MPRVRRTAAHRRLHSVRHRAARCVGHRAPLVRTVAATCAHSACRWAAGAVQHRARQSHTVADQRAQRPPDSVWPLRAATVRMVAHLVCRYSAPCAQLQCAVRAATVHRARSYSALAPHASHGGAGE
ncbi:putative LRR receptor-like serine/threonine-protein kinase [Dorcoceras hygrometricum]|uniref:Putative LRR receptor-like serine/threonine-protein kinase n=1 Tax=Dorcoceras hygrometricum TaxID=472368 RepID=A0A2Z7ARI0_9LAMI|nr:putative LRR receptor-like serine/threonine-protein kinase [Dorcoceras hygrometricum]